MLSGEAGLSPRLRGTTKGQCALSRQRSVRSVELNLWTVYVTQNLLLRWILQWTCLYLWHVSIILWKATIYLERDVMLCQHATLELLIVTISFCCAVKPQNTVKHYSAEFSTMLDHSYQSKEQKHLQPTWKKWERAICQPIANNKLISCH